MLKTPFKIIVRHTLSINILEYLISDSYKNTFKQIIFINSILN